jgi:hypothetical protein
MINLIIIDGALRGTFIALVFCLGYLLGRIEIRLKCKGGKKNGIHCKI